MIQDFDLTAWSQKPFQSNAEMVAAMRRPEYRDPMNDAYRDAVTRKIAIAQDVGVRIRVGPREQREQLDSLAAVHQTEAGKAQAEEIRQAETTAAELFGQQAVRPPVADSEGWEASERRL